MTQANSSTPTPSATHIIAVGLTLFSMFFGAGNLIFPPLLGAQSGHNFLPAILGFVTTGVLLPVITVIAVAISGSGVRDLASRAGATFGVIFSCAAYLSIGAFYALPRTGSTAYTLGFENDLNLEGALPRFIFTVIFFGISFLLVLFPGKIVDSLGKVLTPALLILLLFLVIKAVFTLNDPPIQANEKFADSPYITGVIEGYFTMDSIASLAFAILVISSFTAKGVSDHKVIVRSTASAALLAGFFLMIIYVLLGVMGKNMPNKESYSDGASLISSASGLVLGGTGNWIFSGIVVLACLTTAAGLIASSSAFFNELIPAVSYRIWCVIFTLTSLGIANLGLERILSLSAPVIGLIYPVAISLILVTVFHMTVGTLKIPQ